MLQRDDEVNCCNETAGLRDSATRCHNATSYKMSRCDDDICDVTTRTPQQERRIAAQLPRNDTMRRQDYMMMRRDDEAGENTPNVRTRVLEEWLSECECRVCCIVRLTPVSGRCAISIE